MGILHSILVGLIQRGTFSYIIQSNMKVYFSVAVAGFNKHKDCYLHIRRLILDSGSKLIIDWIPEYVKKTEKGQTTNNSKFYNKVIKAIELSDVAIFEGTVSSMSVGHQMTYCLHRQKPTLLLVNKNIRKARSLFIAGSNSPNLYIQEFDSEKDLYQIIKRFIKDNSNVRKHRLNLALGKKQNDYLVWAAYTHHTSKTEIAKKAINKGANSDEKYQEMLSTRV